MKYSALLLDNKSSSIALLMKYLVEEYASIKILESAETMQEFIVLVNKLQPDIIFMDLDDENGSISDSLSQLNKQPHLILMSSNKELAMQAFQLNAIGFILKPIEKTSLELAIISAVRNIESYRRERSYNSGLNIVVIPSKEFDDILNLDEVLYLKADGRCTIFYMINNKTFMSYKNFSAYNFLLDRDKSFIQISRSHIINIKHLKKVTKKTALYCELINDVTLPISRRMACNFKHFLNTFK